MGSRGSAVCTAVSSSQPRHLRLLEATQPLHPPLHTLDLPRPASGSDQEDRPGETEQPAPSHHGDDQESAGGGPRHLRTAQSPPPAAAVLQYIRRLSAGPSPPATIHQPSQLHVLHVGGDTPAQEEASPPVGGF